MRPIFARTLCAFALFNVPLNAHAQSIDDPAADSAPGEAKGQAFIMPARMASSYLDSPNSVTSLSTDTLEKLGIVDFADAMRLVPGMQVSRTHGSDVSVGYHGANVNVPRRTEVLYNSNHLYRPGYAGAHWYRFPLDIRDLNFIEVTRGPTLEYGPNGMTSTVNFIQDSPATRGIEALARVGDNGTRDVYLKAGFGSGGTQVGARYFHRENNGFDGAEGFVGQYNNDLKSDSFMLNLEHYLNPSLLLDVATSFIRASYEVPGFNNISNANDETQRATDNFLDSPATDEINGFFSAKIHTSFAPGDTSHDLVFGVNYTLFSREQRLNLCAPRLTLDPLVLQVSELPSVELSLDDEIAFGVAAITGKLELEHSLIATPSASEQALIDQLGKHVQNIGLALFDDQCGYTDQDIDEDRWEIETHIVSQLSQDVQNAFGVSVAVVEADSDTYLGGNVTQHVMNVYDNIRFSLSPRLVLNAGLSVDALDSSKTDVSLSYRLAANYHFNNKLVLRLMNAQSQRTPDLHELERDWTYRVTYLNNEADHLGRSSGLLALRSHSPDKLSPETLRTTEVGLTYQYHDGVLIDGKVFYEDYTDLISEPFSFANFHLTNDGKLENSGAEFSIQHSPSSAFYWGTSYAYLDSKSNNPFEQTLRARHSGALWAIASFGEGTDLSAAYYGASKVGNGSYDRLDLTLSHKTRLSKGALTFQINYRHYPNGINAFTEISYSEPNVGLIDGQDRILATIMFTLF